MTTRTKPTETPTALAPRPGPAPAVAREDAVHDTLLKRGRTTAGTWAAVPVSLAAAGAVALSLLGLGWYLVLTAPSHVKITPAAYERVAEGMGGEEVRAAIGLPAGDYRDGAHKPGGRWFTEWSEEAAQQEFGDGDTADRLAWEGNAYSIVVGFDEAGGVQWKTLWKHVPPTPHGPVERVLAWLDR
jgi:hypothetical protein